MEYIQDSTNRKPKGVKKEVDENFSERGRDNLNDSVLYLQTP